MKYLLLTKQNEVINRIEASNLEEAIELFSKLKKLSIDKLLTIYQVVPN